MSDFLFALSIGAICGMFFMNISIWLILVIVYKYFDKLVTELK